MYQDFDNGLARERTAQIRAEVSHNRLAARLARTARPDAGGVARGGKFARGTRLVTALLGFHPTS